MRLQRQNRALRLSTEALHSTAIVSAAFSIRHSPFIYARKISVAKPAGAAHRHLYHSTHYHIAWHPSVGVCKSRSHVYRTRASPAKRQRERERETAPSLGSSWCASIVEPTLSLVHYTVYVYNVYVCTDLLHLGKAQLPPKCARNCEISLSLSLSLYSENVHRTFAMLALMYIILRVCILMRAAMLYIYIL